MKINKHPLVSIVMAAYNEEHYIKESIDSILNQTYTKFEFIIINDGSTDRTEEIIKSFNDQRIIYIKNESNLKLINSLNKGLALAKGELIARMDADDIAYPFRIKRQVEFMCNNPDIGISGSQLVLFGGDHGLMNYPLIHKEIMLKLFISSCFGNNVVIFRKEILLENNLFYSEGYLHAEDYKSWTKWIFKTKAANLLEPLVKYRVHNNSISTKYTKIQRETRNRVRLEYIQELFNCKENDRLKYLNSTSSIAKINAFRELIRLNYKKDLFTRKELKAVLNQLWYLDVLEESEKSILVFFKFSLIFLFSFESNFKKWIYVFKHIILIKVRLVRRL